MTEGMHTVLHHPIQATFIFWTRNDWNFFDACQNRLLGMRGWCGTRWILELLEPTSSADSEALCESSYPLLNSLSAITTLYTIIGKINHASNLVAAVIHEEQQKRQTQELSSLTCGSFCFDLVLNRCLDLESTYTRNRGIYTTVWTDAFYTKNEPYLLLKSQKQKLYILYYHIDLITGLMALSTCQELQMLLYHCQR